jgi:REP element-mobilizing transposase RayT
MGTFTQILYQIVYSTKERNKTLSREGLSQLFSYKARVLKRKNCHVYEIGGVEDHVHLITHLHPTVALADLVKDLKLSSSDFMKSSDLFPDFTNWQEGYAAFTYSIEAKENLIKYVFNQHEHHRKKTFIEELKELLIEHKIEFDEKYLL